MDFNSKLPNVGTTIFTVMSSLAREHNAINLSQGFPNFDCSPKLKELVYDYMKKGFNQYAPMAGAAPLREILAHKIESLYGAKINPATEITITAGATQAIYTAISAFVHPGDEVILIEPAYDSYGPAIEVNGGIPVPYELRAPEFQVDWADLKKLVTPKTRMICVNTPHNPSGTILKAEDLEELQKLLAGTNILLLSDEVYEHLIFDGAAHQSALRFSDLFERTLATYSFGKTFHNTGWKLGYCVAPEHLMNEFRKVHQFNVFSCNTPVQHAIADYLQEPETYLGLSAFYQEKRDQFLGILSQTKFKPIRCEGTYFQTVDYSAISDENDVDFAKRITKEYGIASIPVSVFYSQSKYDKVIRFCFAKTPELLEQAGEILIKI